MKPTKIQLGAVFVRWTVTGEAERRGKYRFWLCVCKCGTIKHVNACNLLNGTSKSCGCVKTERSRETAINNKKLFNPGTHKMSRSAEYRIWQGIKTRCLNPNSRVFQYYGKRGITISPEWMKFEAFYQDMGPRPIGMEIERIDNNLGYCKDNCKWADREDQMNNVRSNSNVTLNGVTHSLSKWARLIGIDKRTLKSWIMSGRPETEILEKKYRPNNQWHYAERRANGAASNP